jgi:RNA polymerase sigma factor (sigma-70 family)
MADTPLGVLLQHFVRIARGQSLILATDGELLEHFRDRQDQAAFAALVRRHGPMVLSVCRRLLGHAQDAEDAFQATFLVLTRKVASIRKHESLGSWLYGVAYHVASKARAQRARRQAHEREARRIKSGPAIKAAWQEVHATLDEALAQLPEKYRAALILCYLQGYRHEEAARQLGCPLATLRSRVARGRALLRAGLARRGLTLSVAGFAALLATAAADAALPGALFRSTLSLGRAATRLATGQAAGSVAVSANVAALAEGVLKAMLLTKLKIATAVLLVFGVLGTAAVGLLTDASTAAARSPTAGPEVAAERSGEGTDRRGAADKPAWREMVTMKHEHAITAVACSADWSVAGDEGGILFAWDTKTGKNRTLVVKRGFKSVDRLQFTADEKDLYTPDGKGLYVIWGGRQGIARYFMKDNKIEGGWGFGGGDFDGVARGYLGVSADGEIWLEFFREGRAVNLRRNAYEFKMGKFFVRPNFDPNHHELVEYKAKVSHALVSAGEKWLAVATDDGTLHIHDRASLQETHTIAAGKKGLVIKDVQFSADGQRIAVARDDGLAKVYDTAKGDEVTTLKGHSGIIFAVAFSPDGKTVVTGGDDNTARVWDAATGKALATLQGHTDSIRCVAFDPSGEILITGSADKTVKLWRAR